MSKIRQKQQLESNLFDIIQELHHNLIYKDLDQYKLCLAALDELNETYKEEFGEFYIEPLRCLNYYEKLWSDFQ